MPKAKNHEVYWKKYNENKLKNAIEAINNGMSKREAAKVFCIPRSTLQFRMYEKFNQTRHGSTTVLTHEEELCLNLQESAKNKLTVLSDITLSSDPENEPLQNYLYWPQTPVRKAKHEVEKTLFILTSSTYKEMQDRKEKVTTEKEKEKESQKLERENKRKKQIEQKSKKKIKGNTLPLNKEKQQSENKMVSTESCSSHVSKSPFLNHIVIGDMETMPAEENLLEDIEMEPETITKINYKTDEQKPYPTPTIKPYNFKENYYSATTAKTAPKILWGVTSCGDNPG
ncbi:hypothetical protein ILUMI_08038 [Ignelater luminosus]|uniref:HTH psq-type domain-containing protein n=1 Tax=Ignelater luminosus TaxID=2038154 RepID=A0A8K0GB17_IGNLU|nr:hypothetical protein ILUMI_08038 [Ignelater luminosus]